MCITGKPLENLFELTMQEDYCGVDGWGDPIYVPKWIQDELASVTTRERIIKERKALEGENE